MALLFAPQLVLTACYEGDIYRQIGAVPVQEYEVVGLAVNRTGILSRRGNNVLAVYSTRGARFVRESLLTWAFLLGIYSHVSDEAEWQEQSSATDLRYA